MLDSPGSQPQPSMALRSWSFHSSSKDGDKVRVSMWFRGREMAHPQVGEQILRRMAQQLADVSVVERPPLMEGRNMIMILAPKKN